MRSIIFPSTLLRQNLPPSSNAYVAHRHCRASPHPLSLRMWGHPPLSAHVEQQGINVWKATLNTIYFNWNLPWIIRGSLVNFFFSIYTFCIWFYLNKLSLGQPYHHRIGYSNPQILYKVKVIPNSIRLGLSMPWSLPCHKCKNIHFHSYFKA